MNKQKIEKDLEFCKTIKDFIIRYEYYYKGLDADKKIEVLEIIAQKNRLAALLIIDTNEEDKATNIISKVFVKSLLEDTFVYGDIEQSTTNMQCALVVLKHLDRKTLQDVANVLFSQKKYFSENVNTSNDLRGMSLHYANIMSNAISSMPYSYKWEESYYKIITAITKALKKDYNFTNRLEANLRDKKFTSINKNMYFYFCSLCSIGSFDGAKFFLERIWDESSKLFGLEDDKFIKLFCSYASPRIVSFCLEYITIHNIEYSETEWIKDVLKYNKDSETLKWINVHRSITDLYHHIVEDKKESYFEILKDASDIEMFDLEKCTYMTKMISRLAQIFNSIILENGDVSAFLDNLGDLNLFDYQYIQYTSAYRNYDGVIDYTDFQALEKKLFAMTDPNMILRIYMNTHLRFHIDLRDVIEFIDALLQSEYDYTETVHPNLFNDIFNKYPIIGYISKIDDIQSGRNKIYLLPKYLYTKWTYIYACGVSEKNNNIPCLETQEAFNKVIRNDELWYKHNKKWSELLSEYDECTFLISKFIRKDSLILASNIKKENYEKEQRERENLPNLVLAWLDEIKANKKAIEWDRENRIYGIRNIENNKSRERVALSILETIVELVDDEIEIRKLLQIFQKYPMEELNEFRYIRTQKWCDFKLTNFFLGLNKIQLLADTLFNSENLSSGTKLDVFLNTCIKKFYELEKVCQFIGDEIFSDNIIIPLAYKGRKNNICLFSTNGKYSKKNVLFSKYNFQYETSDEFKTDWVYFVNLESFDESNRCFWIKRVFSADQFRKSDGMVWNEFIRCLFDLKKDLSFDNKESLKTKIKELSIDITSTERIKQFTLELYRTFRHYGYNVIQCDAILDVLDNSNPFIAQDNIFDSFQEEFTESYSDAYEQFLSDIKINDRDLLMICNVFYLSFLRIIIPSEKFISDMVELGKRKEGIETYCRLKEIDF